MPFGPGTYGDGGGGLAAPALARQGIPEMLGGQQAAPAGPQDQLSQLLMMLRRGEAGAEKVMQVLAMMAQATVPQMDGGAAPQQQQPGIQDLLG